MVSIGTLLSIVGVILAPGIVILGALISTLVKIGKLETRIEIYKTNGDDVQASVSALGDKMEAGFKEVEKSIHKISLAQAQK